MGKSKVVQMKKIDKSQDARKILQNGIVNEMSVEKLIQLADINVFVGNVEVMVGLCGTSNYFNRMEYVKANNDEECDILSLLYADGENIIASTTLSTEKIVDIDGCVNADNPDNVLDINITMADGIQATINLIIKENIHYEKNNNSKIAEDYFRQSCISHKCSSELR